MKTPLRYSFGLLILLLLIASCTPRMERFFATQAEVEWLPAEEGTPPGRMINGRVVRLQVPVIPGGTQPEDYQPDPAWPEHTPAYELRVNFHFVDTPEGGYNYDEQAGREMISQLMGSANKDLRENNPVWLPYGNQMPTLPVGYRMRMARGVQSPEDDGIYFHRDAELAFYVHTGRNRNLYRKDVVNKYGVGLDSIMNIFILPHHPDSVLSPSYHVGSVGVYLGNAIKMAGMYELSQPGWAYRGVLNHEMGHALGLQHAWGRDGCEDTPNHQNECWNRSRQAPCDTAASNNVMDYNAYQNAWSPCQVGRVRRSLTSLQHPKRRYLIPFWEQLDTSRNIVIRGTLRWSGARDLKGNLIIAPRAQLTLTGRLGMPAGGRIRVQAGGTLILKNALLHHPGSKQWAGIELEKKGRLRGRIVMDSLSRVERARYPLLPGTPQQR